jgi:dipeptidyl aminopeptidase/acylaminoacyl peptidase
MRYLAGLAVAVCACAQQPGFTLDQVLGAPFPSELTASPTGAKVAWISNARGVRNILVAEAPAWQTRKVTSYTADDGQELSELQWTPDGSALVYVRGMGTNGAGEIPNPAHDPKGSEQAIWIVPLNGGPARKLADGDSPTVSPKGDRIAFLRRGQMWMTSLEGSGAPAQAFQARGRCGQAAWSPDGNRLAFTSGRGDLGFIGIFDVAAASLRYLDPSTDNDLNPEWSPDGTRVAFTRHPSSGLRPVREAQREGQPWSIRVAAVDTGKGREIWRAKPGPGSIFRAVTAKHQVMWADGGRLVFPWEASGWTQLFSVPVEGGTAVPLTRGQFEVEDVALASGGREVIFSANLDDIDRRHLWKVGIAGGERKSLTTGTGIECAPAPAGTSVAFLRSDAQKPLRPAVLTDGQVRDLEALPADFPAAQMVTPQQVIFSSADGLPIHGQLFLPKNRTGKSPALVFFHGGSRRQMLLGWHYMYYYANAYALNQYLANSGYIVLSVNYRSGIGYGLNFREALNYGASGGTEYNDVQGAGVYLRSRSDVDPARIGTWGGSYGGYLVAMGLARSSDLYKAGVDFHGVHDWATELNIPITAPDHQVAFESSPMRFVSGWRSPVLLIHGDDDRNVQFNQTVMLADALRKNKVDFEELILPDEIHDFLMYRSWREAYQATVEFFKKAL